MSLANRSFKNNKTGDVIKVIDSFENIAILENKQKIDTRALMDTNQYTEQIDPASFFNNQGAYNILAEKIKNISTNDLPDDPAELTAKVTTSFASQDMRPSTNESAIVMSSEEDERAELERKYGIQQPSAQDSLARQNQAFAKLLGEDEVEPIRNNKKDVIQNNRSIQDYEQPVQRVEIEDPIIKMFKGVKRNVNFNISIDINNKIPRLDFIEMMEDSYETSIIDFLSDEFTKEIISNPSKIKSMISDKIKSMLSNKLVNDQITDSVTQINSHKQDLSINEQIGEVKVVKPKVARKPRPNTAQGEKPGFKSPRTKKEN